MSFILFVLLGLLIAYLVNYFLTTEKEGLENYQDYSGDDIKVMVYKNAGNIAALKDAVDKLVNTSTDTQGRLTSLEKEHDNLTTVVKETKATADETKANVESAVTDAKAQGDDQANALNDVSFDEETSD
jgi:hypothetical protein